MIDQLKDIFNEVYLLMYGYEYQFKNKSVEKSLQNFIKKIPSRAGEDWLYSFIIFQFSYYDGQKTRFDRIYTNWIFGEKALERWRDRTEAQIYYADQYKVKLGVRREREKLSAKEYMNRERLRFDDNARQFIHCNELSLFDKKSVFCNNCIFFISCQKHAM